MLRDPKLYLNDILQAITKIQKWTQGMNLDDFESDELIHDAVLRNLEIMGEAVKGLPLELTTLHPEIPWRTLGDFRNRPRTATSALILTLYGKSSRPGFLHCCKPFNES